MDCRQNVSEWLQNCKPTRSMSPGAEMDIDIDIGPSRSGATQGQLHLPPASVVSTSMTNNTTSAQPTIAFHFFMAHKALMDPQNFLQLTTRYTNKEILAWANEELKRSVLDEKQLKKISQTAISSVAQKIENGEEMLRNAMQFARQHNRLNCYHNTTSSHHQRRKGTTLVSQNIESWYNLISNAAETSDKVQKRLWSKAYVGSATPFGKIFGDLMYDPLFTYRSLQAIPDRVLLEYCISHSYEHVADKINLNNADAGVSPQHVVNYIEMVLHNPAVWDIAITTTQTSTREKTLPTIQLLPHAVAPPAAVRIEAPRLPTADDYFKKCANCLDIGSKSCLIARVQGKSPSRQPGQHCTKCKTLGVTCTDRLKPVKVVIQAPPTRAPCTHCAQQNVRCEISSFSKCCNGCAWEINSGKKVLCSYIIDEYRQRQSTGGHERETIKQGTFDDFASKGLRQRVSRLLDCSGDAKHTTTPNDAAQYSNFKEGELRLTIASLSQTASEAQAQLAASITDESASECPTIVIDNDSDTETVKAPASDDDDCSEPDDYYDSMCESLVDQVMLD
jgi:hypothetical protein